MLPCNPHNETDKPEKYIILVIPLFDLVLEYYCMMNLSKVCSLILSFIFALSMLSFFLEFIRRVENDVERFKLQYFKAKIPVEKILNSNGPTDTQQTSYSGLHWCDTFVVLSTISYLVILNVRRVNSMKRKAMKVHMRQLIDVANVQPFCNIMVQAKKKVVQLLRFRPRKRAFCSKLKKQNRWQTKKGRHFRRKQQLTGTGLEDTISSDRSLCAADINNKRLELDIIPCPSTLAKTNQTKCCLNNLTGVEIIYRDLDDFKKYPSPKPPRPECIEKLDLTFITNPQSFQLNFPVTGASSDGFWSPSKLRSGNISFKSTSTSANVPIQMPCLPATNSPIQPSSRQAFISDLSRYNALKDAELSLKLDSAKHGMIYEISKLKASSQDIKEKFKFTKAEIYECPKLKARGEELKKINIQKRCLKLAIKQSKKNVEQIELQLNTKSKEKCVKKELTALMAKEQMDFDRYNEVRSTILRRIKSAMEIHWTISATQKGDHQRPKEGLAQCYECISGGHKHYAVAGMDNIMATTTCKLLGEHNGFIPTCPFVILVNSWCQDSEIDKCANNGEKANKLEGLLRRVLKEFFNKRYLNRGQLPGHVFRSVFDD